MHYAEFARWYIGCLLILFGIAMTWKGQALSMCKRFFILEMRDPLLRDRFERVVARRDELEGDNTIAWRITGFSSAVFGALVLARVLVPVVGYALLCADLAIIMSQIYLSMRNRSERRAASLQPRTVYSTVPPVCFVGAVLSSCLPLALVVDPATRYSAVIVALACAAIVIVAARTSQMAAMLSGDDPDIELYVDNRLRWSRVSSLLALGYAASYFFISVSTPGLRESSPAIFALQIVSSMLCLAFAIWALTVYFQQRMRSKTPIYK